MNEAFRLSVRFRYSIDINMSDKITKDRRSANMAKIRSKDTKPELKVREILHKLGYRFRLHRKDLPGRPDIVLPKHRTVIFVNGCFWHRHGDCREASRPKSNSEYWETKLKRNVERDTQNYSLLSDLKWKVMVFWECEVEGNDDIIISVIRNRLIEYGI